TRDLMAKRHLLLLLFVPGFLASSAIWIGAQESTPDSPPDSSVIRKVVEMVQLNVAVTDKKGNYVTGLSPADFVIVEDRIPQKIATFEEGTGAPQNLEGPGQGTAAPQLIPRGAAGLKSGSPEIVDQSNASQTSPTSIYILFDTSNYMYRGRGFVFAQDAIAEFIRSIEGLNRIAFYSYSRDLSRQTALTADRNQVLHGVRATVNGDDSALYNALLLT